MKVKLTPQYNPTNTILYVFGQDSFEVKLNGVSDSFDFSKVSAVSPHQIKTVLPVNPVMSVERIDGELYLTLLHYIGEEATETERFPHFQEV